jgi:hypothetical protein
MAALVRQARPVLLRRRRARTLAGALAGTCLVAAAVLSVAGRVPVTTAHFGDQGNANIGAEGIGSSAAFDIGLVQDGVLRQGEGEGISWNLDASELVPGRVVEAVVPVVNNGPYAADVTVRVEDLHDEAVTGAMDPFMMYRWSITDADTGELLAGSPDPLASTVGGAEVADHVAPFPLAARGGEPVADAAAWEPGAAGSVRTLRIVVAYPDTPESAAYNGGISRMRVVFSAMSS